MTNEIILEPTPVAGAAPTPANGQPSPRRNDHLQRRLEQSLREPRVELDVSVDIGPYSLQAPLSTQGNQIWRAHDRELDRTVVIRLFNPELWQPAEQGELARAFWDGARLMAKLGRVTRCPSLLDGPETTGGWLWFAIEHYPLNDLESALRRGLIKAPQKERVFDEIASALSELHLADFKHRDLALNNVLVMDSSDGPHAYLSDYDLSTVASPVTLPNSTPYYTRGGRTDAVTDRGTASDVRALCVLLFKLYTSSETDVPENPTRAQLRAKLASSNADPMVRARIARICARGLGGEGFDKAEEVRDAWRRRGAERWATVVGFVLLLCGLSWLSLVVDYFVSPYVQTKWIQFGSVLLGLGIFAWLANLARDKVPALYGKAVEWSTAYPARAIAAAVVLALFNVTTWCVTDFSQRLESYYFDGQHGCKVARVGNDEPLDLDTVKADKKRGNTILVHIAGARTVSCPDTKPTYWGASFFTHALDFEEVKKPAPSPPCDAKGPTAPPATAAPSASAPVAIVPSAVASTAGAPSAHPSASSHMAHPPPSAVAIVTAPPPTAVPAVEALREPSLVAQQEQVAAQVQCKLCDENGRSCVRDCGTSYAYDPARKAACRVYCDTTYRECRSSNKCTGN